MTPTKVKAQVIASGVSYFSVEEVLGPDGEPDKNAKGDPIRSTLRHEAYMTDVVEMSKHEFDRLKALGAVREPSDEPIHRGPVATPFGVPLRDENDQLRAFAGPVMGDPNPAGATLSDTELRRAGGALTPEQAAELERAAAEGFGGEPFNPGEATSDEIAEHIDEKNLNTDATLELAKVDGEYDEVLAERVLEAEQSREKPRKGVVAELEHALDEEEEE